MRVLIKNGRVIDPSAKRDGLFDVLTENEEIIKVAPSIDASEADGGRIIDAEGFYVCRD